MARSITHVVALEKNRFAAYAGTKLLGIVIGLPDENTVMFNHLMDIDRTVVRRK